MNFIKILLSPRRFLNWLFLFILLSTVEFFLYPITAQLFKKKQIKNINELTDDEIKQLENCYETYYKQFNVTCTKEDFLATLYYFSSLDNQVIYDPDTSKLFPINLQYIFILFTQAIDGLKQLDKVSKDDKTISYYESTSKIDDLLKYYKEMLNAKNEKELTLSVGRNEIRVRRWLVHMKKHHGLYFNMYLSILTLFPPHKFKMDENEKDVFLLMQNLFSFYRLGHATQKQIHKSVAIQIYKVYEKHDKVKIQDLKSHIGDLIDYVMHTDMPYKNFNDIDQEPYIKNIVHDFVLFDCNTDTSHHQMKSFRRYTITKNTLYPWWLPKFIRIKIFDKFLDSPLSMYRRMAFITFFGFLSKKK